MFQIFALPHCFLPLELFCGPRSYFAIILFFNKINFPKITKNSANQHRNILKRGSSVKNFPWICWSKQTGRDLIFYPNKIGQKLTENGRFKHTNFTFTFTISRLSNFFSSWEQNLTNQHFLWPDKKYQTSYSHWY